MTRRPHTTEVAAAYLQHVLADGAVYTSELEAKARAEGLLGENQRIQHAKPFKNAKKVLGIRSIRDGFGSGGKWAWLMPPGNDQKEIASAANSDLETDEQHSVRDAKPLYRRTAKPESRDIVQQWIEGVERLDYVRSPTAVQLIRWHLFLGGACRSSVAAHSSP